MILRPQRALPTDLVICSECLTPVRRSEMIRGRQKFIRCRNCRDAALSQTAQAMQRLERDRAYVKRNLFDHQRAAAGEREGVA